MKKGSLRRTAALTLVLVFLLALAAPALAAEYVQATQSCQVRRSANADSGSLGTLSKGAVAQKLGTQGIWTKIDFNGRTGFVLSSNVKASTGSVSVGGGTTYYPDYSNTGSSSARTAMYASSPVNVRSGPGTHYSLLGELGTNDVVYSVGQTGNWRIIEWNGGTAYVSAGYLRAYSGSTGSTGGTASGTWMKATSPVNVRSGPGTKYSIVGELTRGETVQKLGISGNWTKVNYYGKTAYVSSGYLTLSNTGSSSTGGSGSSGTGTVVPPSENLNDRLYALRRTDIRTGPGSGYTRIGTLDAGDYVYYSGSSSGSWYRVSFGSHAYAYVYKYDVEFWNSGGTPSSGYVYATSTVPVYTSMSTSASRLGTLYQGESVQRTATYNNGWIKINYNGREGYVQSYLVATGSGNNWPTDNMYSVNAYRNALSSNVRCYTAPVSSNSYLRGYLSKGERVYVEEANSSWSKCRIQGEIMYVRTSDLSSYDTGWNSGWDNGWWGYGNRAYVRNATQTYKYSTGYDRGDTIPAGTTVSVSSYQYDDRVLVSWSVGNSNYSGYVSPWQLDNYYY